MPKQYNNGSQITPHVKKNLLYTTQYKLKIGLKILQSKISILSEGILVKASYKFRGVPDHKMGSFTFPLPAMQMRYSFFYP